jgi:hypothetical protein
VKFTSRIVAAFCGAHQPAADELPGIIAAVGRKLDELHNGSFLKEAAGPDAAKASRTAIPLRALERWDRSLLQDDVRSRVGSGGTGRLGEKRLATSNIRAHVINPKAVAAVSSADQDEMAEIARASDYLPSRNSGRVEEAGSGALRDGNVVPFSLAVAARLRRARSIAEPNRPKPANRTSLAGLWSALLTPEAEPGER